MKKVMMLVACLVPWHSRRLLSRKPLIGRLRRPMMFGKSRQQLVPPRAALFYAKTCSIEMTRTTCDQIGPVRLLNRASSEKSALRCDLAV